MEADIVNLRPFGGFGVVLADPPWSFENFSALGEAKSAKRHYPCMPTSEICRMPVASLTGTDAALFLWATFPMLPDAMRVVQAWGFTYRSAAPWAKRSRKGHGWAFGPGYWWRGASELLIFATRGSPRRADSKAARSIRNLIVAPLREHSRKPEDAHTTAEAWFPAARKIELFARAPRDGWTVWGNQTDKFEATRP